jgi:hypothetical protein
MEVDATSAGSRVMVGFGTGNVEPSSFAIIVLIIARNVSFSLGNICDVCNPSTIP